jgi:hypothetical protein
MGQAKQVKIIQRMFCFPDKRIDKIQSGSGMVSKTGKKGFGVGHTAGKHLFKLPGIILCMPLLKKKSSRFLTGNPLFTGKEKILYLFCAYTRIRQGKSRNYGMSCSADTTPEPENINGMPEIPFPVLRVSGVISN